MEWRIILEILGYIGFGGLLLALFKHYLSGDSRKENRLKKKVGDLATNVELIDNFGQKIIELEIQALELKRANGKHNDRIIRLLEKTERLRESIKNVRKISDDELDYLELKINDIEAILRQKI